MWQIFKGEFDDKKRRQFSFLENDSYIEEV